MNDLCRVSRHWLFAQRLTHHLNWVVDCRLLVHTADDSPRVVWRPSLCCTDELLYWCLYRMLLACQGVSPLVRLARPNSDYFSQHRVRDELACQPDRLLLGGFGTVFLQMYSVRGQTMKLGFSYSVDEMYVIASVCNTSEPRRCNHCSEHLHTPSVMC